MDKNLIKVVVRRFIELLFTCIIFSAAVTSFYYIINHIVGFTNNIHLCCLLLIGVAGFVFVNVRMLKMCYFDLRNNYWYFFTNIAAYLIFIVTTFVTCYFSSNEFYIWLFSITKFARFSNIGMEIYYSILIFHAIGLLMIVFAPIDMFWITMKDVDDEGDVF